MLAWGADSYMPVRCKLNRIVCINYPSTINEQQTDINEKMRAILIDWLVEVHLKFKVRKGTRSTYLT